VKPRFDASAPLAIGSLTRAEPGELGQILTWTVAAFVVISLTVGGVWSLAVDDLRWSVWRVALLVGFAPAVAVAVLLAFASFRRILNAVESLTGYDLDGNGAVGEDRLIPVFRERPRTLNGVDQPDLIEFVRAAYATGRWSQADWRGKRFNSGRVCQNEYHAQLIGLLTTAGVLVDTGARKRGRLAIEDVNEALKRLNAVN
jgi:MFS family permease